MRVSILLFLSFVPFINAEAIRQCLCKPYEKCLKTMKHESVETCLAKCEKVSPSSAFLGCIKKFIPEFNQLRACSYSRQNGFRGCTSQKSNVLSERSMAEFRDYVISAMEEKIENFDASRQFMSPEAALQGECVFGCFYPGRNECTKKLKCDILLPPEDIFFNDFHACASKKSFFKKANEVYGCISQLMVMRVD